MLNFLNKPINWFSLCFVFLISGCEIETIEEAVGEPWTLKETKALEGQWRDSQFQLLEVGVVSKGEIRMGQLQWSSDKNEFTAHNDRIQLRHLGKMDFAFLEMQEEATRRYSLARISKSDDGTIHWQWPDEKLVLEAIRTGKLKGELEKVENSKSLHPHLKCSAEELTKWISETGEAVVFPNQKDDAYVLKKYQPLAKPKP